MLDVAYGTLNRQDLRRMLDEHIKSTVEFSVVQQVILSLLDYLAKLKLQAVIWRRNLMSRLFSVS
jgi:phage baseplate assembly protein W